MSKWLYPSFHCNFLSCLLFMIKNQTHWKSFCIEIHANLQHLHPIWWIPVKFVLLRDSQVLCFLLQTWSVVWRSKWWQPTLSTEVTWNFLVRHLKQRASWLLLWGLINSLLFTISHNYNVTIACKIVIKYCSWN